MASRPRLVIIGSGWAGFYIAENIDLSSYAVTLISPRRTSAYTPLLASAAVGLFNFYLAEEPVRSKSRNRLSFAKATVEDIDFDRKLCKCTPAFEEGPHFDVEDFEVEYDYLVIAPGCIPNTFETPGVAEYGLFIKNVSDAMTFRKRLFDLLEMAALPNVTEEQARALLHIAIVGGGPTGVEITAELDDLCKEEISQVYPTVSDYLSISLYDVAPNILTTYDSRLHEYATKQLRNRKINVAPNTEIERVEKDTIHIKGKDSVPYGMLVWATGNKNAPLIDRLEEHLKFPEKGLKRILTDNRLRAFQHKDGIFDSVFAIGDAGDIDGESLPTTAEVAVQKAKYLVRNFNGGARNGGEMFKQPFRYDSKPLVSYIGSRDGVIAGKEADDDGWTGASAWLSWRGSSLMWNRNWRSRVAIILTWGLNAIFGTEMAKM